MDSQIPTYESAEALRTSRDYAKACEQFAYLWQQSPNPYIGWRYAFCLRKTGQLEEAERIARAALEKYPGDRYAKAELGWILYEQLKLARDKGNLVRVIDLANQIFALNSDKNILVRAVLSVMKVAKSRGKWEIVLEWADRLTPKDLDNQPRVVGGKRYISDRWTWYVNRAHALLKLNRFEEARLFAQEGLVEFPNDVFLRRIIALSLARSGDWESGIVEMRQLLIHPRSDWYVRAELAEMEYRIGNYSEAYRLICEAMLATRQTSEYRLRYFVILAKIALALHKTEVAAAHITLAEEIRKSQGWKIPTELTQTKSDVLRACNQKWPDLPKDIAKLEQLCRRYWQEGIDEGVVFYSGTVLPYPEGRAFTYIKRDDGSDDVFVLVRDLPAGCQRPGSRVKFALTKSFDKKKQRESVQATKIRPLSEA